MAKNTQQKITIERQGGATVVKIYPVEDQQNTLETSTTNSTAVAQTPVDIMVNENQPSSKVATLQQNKNETITVTDTMATVAPTSKPIEVFADKKSEDTKPEEKKPEEIKLEEKKSEDKKTLNCVSAECDYGAESPLGRKAPYDRRMEPVPPTAGKPAVNPKEIKTKSLPAADPSKPSVEPSIEQAGLSTPLPQSLSSTSSPEVFSSSIENLDHTPEFLDQMQNMELSRQLDRESKIKTTMDLRQLRGEDDDKDSEAVRDLEQIEMDKINLNKIKIKKHKKEDKVKMDEQSIIKKLSHES